MNEINEFINSIQHSKFRSSFTLTKKEKEYVTQKGMEVIRSHSADFIRKKISDAYPTNDGKQTPMSGHPSFKAMHACACCCRECLEKWHHIPQYRPLTEAEQRHLVDIMMAWIELKMK